jgi:hypothetical protein
MDEPKQRKDGERRKERKKEQNRKERRQEGQEHIELLY